METLQRTANRGSVPTGYDIDNSVKLEADNTESLTRSTQDGGDRKKVTISFWTKRTELTSSYEMLLMAGVNGSKYSSLGFQTTNALNFHYYNSGSYPYDLTTTRLFRDTSAWYHIVIAMDTTQATAANRVKIYVNGVQETSFTTEVYPTQNIDTPFNNDSATYPIEIGNDSVFSIGGIPYSGYLADYYLIDGQQLAPTDFGEYDEDTGIWKPKAYTGSYGTNGFYLDFESSGSLGADSSGNGNNFTENNITSIDQATDTPTNNFVTMTEAWAYASQLEVRWGGTLTTTNTAAWSGAKSTIGVNKGKWYWEIRWNDTISTYTGIQTQGEDNISASGSIAHARNTSLSIGAGSKYRTYINGTDTLFSSQPSGNISTGEVTGFALDLDSGTKTLKLIRSGSVVQTYTLTDSLATEYVFPFCSTYAQTLVWNLGGFFHYTLSSAETDANGLGSFEFSPTIGGVNYYALCGKNLAEFGGTA